MRKVAILLPMTLIMLSHSSLANELTQKQRCDDLANTAQKAMTFRQTTEISSDILTANEVNKPYHIAVIKSAYEYDIEKSSGAKLELINTYKDSVYIACMAQRL
ncbi:hypothetical protein VCSRO62_0318 [Vibrio cholerae]|nr:hypothetical protein VCSRO62_0318 [Vibrio cholerae]